MIGGYMKKLIKVIVIILIGCIILGAFSKIPTFEDIKTDIKDLLNSSIDEDDSYYKNFKDGVFYVSSGDKMITYDSVSDIPTDIRGFFVKDDIVCYAIKVLGSDDLSVTLDEKDFSYGGYDYCYYVTYDMVTFVNYSDCFSATINGEALIVYCAMDKISENDVRKINDKLLANQPINIQYCDPPMIEGPSA